MIEFIDILLESPAPVHAYLADNSGLSVRLIADGRVYGDIPATKGDLNNGIWEIKSNLYVPEVDQPLTLAVVILRKGHETQFDLAILTVLELSALVKTQPHARHKFSTCNSGSGVEFTMTCSIKLSSSYIANTQGPQAITHGGDGPGVHKKDTEPDAERETLALRNRGIMESAYAKITLIEDQDDKARKLSLLGWRYDILFLETDEKADLEKAISLHEEAMRLTSPSHPQFVVHSHRIGQALQRRFDHGGDPIDLDAAISHWRNVIEVINDGNPLGPAHFSILATALQKRFKLRGNLADMEDSISMLQNAAELTPDDHTDKPSQLGILGDSLLMRFEYHDDLADLKKAISSQQIAVDLAPNDHPNKPSLLSKLAYALHLRFRRLDDPVDMENAISSLQKAVELMPDRHPSMLSLLSSLGSALLIRFERSNNLEDIEHAISNRLKAVELTPDRHPHKPSRLSDLAAALLMRFERFGNPTDLENAISSQQTTVGLTPDNHHDKPYLLCTLADALQLRFDRFGDLLDMDNAISTVRKAVELMPDSEPSLLCSLGCAYMRRFGRTDDPTDIEHAISSLRLAVVRTPEGHPHKPSLLNNYGLALQKRFKRLNDRLDIENAISHLSKAVELTPDGHPDKLPRLSNLGIAFMRRFRQFGVLDDIENSISSLQNAVKLIPADQPNERSLLTNLGNALHSRFERLGDPADIDNAVSSLQKALELTPDRHPSMLSLLNNLATALQTRFERSKDLEDIEDAISNLLKAVQLTPDRHPYQPSRLSNLGMAFMGRFERLGNREDIDNSISNLTYAVNLMPDGHPDKPALLYNLGNVLRSRFELLNTPEDLESALSALSGAATSPAGPPMMRFQAARLWANIAKTHSRDPLQAFKCAIDLLPRVAWLGLKVVDQHALLAQVGSVVRDAVAAAIRLKKYKTAVEWADQGRSITWQNLLGLRTPVDDLRRTRPELANRLQEVSRQLQSTTPHDVLPDEVHVVPMGDIARRYSELAIEFDSLVEEIRTITHFEAFLRAKSFEELAPAAREGPVVIINVQQSQCDALILLPHESDTSRVAVVNVPLQSFSYEKSKTLSSVMKNVLTSAGARMLVWDEPQAGGEEKLREILRILWLQVVKPVIDRLAYQARSSNPPRIWWCATGHLAFLPIHAAGLYGTGGEKVSDYVVSSYIPSLTAILGQSQPLMPKEFKIVAVAQPSAPNASPIPHTEDEIDAIRKYVGNCSLLELTREKATVERVLKEMKTSNWVHFACHGQQNFDEPMKSGLLLHDRILKLSEIVEHSLPNADFAFLSACQTAMGDEKVAEESAHLAAGMLLAGYRAVIATMWSIDDRDAPRVAECVYSRILKNGQPDSREAARALHEAVRLLRESKAGFLSWLPFIHIGR